MTYFVYEQSAGLCNVQADELSPGNNDILKQLDVCKKEKSVRKDTLNDYIQFMLDEMRKGFAEGTIQFFYGIHCVGNSNEAVSYIRDILELRPSEISTLDQVVTLLEKEKAWKECIPLLEKLFKLTKDGDDSDRSCGFLLRRVHANIELVRVGAKPDEQGEYKAAQIGIAYFNSHVPPEKQELDLAKRIDNLLLNPTSNVDRALSIVTERLEVPEVPKTMYELTFQLQKLKDQDLLVQRYLLVFGSCCLSLTLQSIPPEHIASLLQKETVQEAEPYELIIHNLTKILRFLPSSALITQKEHIALLLGDGLLACSSCS